MWRFQIDSRICWTSKRRLLLLFLTLWRSMSFHILNIIIPHDMVVLLLVFCLLLNKCVFQIMNIVLKSFIICVYNYHNVLQWLQYSLSLNVFLECVTKNISFISMQLSLFTWLTHHNNHSFHNEWLCFNEQNKMRINDDWLREMNMKWRELCQMRRIWIGIDWMEFLSISAVK